MKIIKPLENIDKTVFEKYDDYKYPFSKHETLIDAPTPTILLVIIFIKS